MTPENFPRTVYYLDKYLSKITARTVHGIITRDELKAKGTMYLGFKGFKDVDIFYLLKPKGYNSINNILSIADCRDTLESAQDAITARLRVDVEKAAKEHKRAKTSLSKWLNKLAAPAPKG